MLFKERSLDASRWHTAAPYRVISSRLARLMADLVSKNDHFPARFQDHCPDS